MSMQVIEERSAVAASRVMLDIQSDHAVRLVVLRRRRPTGPGTGPGLLEYALSTAPLSRVVFDMLSRLPCCAERNPRTGRPMEGSPRQNILWAAPQEWQTAVPEELGRKVSCADTGGIDPAMLRGIVDPSRLVISNGRFVARVSRWRLEQGLACTAADAVAVMAQPELAAYRERVRLTPQGQLVGYRRLYRDSAEPISVPTDWPHILFLGAEAAAAVANDGLPAEFGTLVERLQSRGLRLNSLAVAGSFIDLETEEGLLSLATMAIGGASCGPVCRQMAGQQHEAVSPGNGGLSPQSRLVGPVLLGDQVCVESDAIIIGPSILCDHSVIRAGAVVDASIVGAGIEVARDQMVRHSVVVAPGASASRRAAAGRRYRRPEYADSQETAAFRSWPRFSYVACLKRVADVVAAAIVLALFAPIIPFIALAVKINSPGPAFFRDRRQGLHGKPFRCVKFRTMRAGADKLQDKLRFISEVDGPQFKMVDDPRITAVGRFLRETFLDEIPQFYNVLMGDMSIVGPRPSPESENTLCPWWRDARLSVRPGITGLWQVCRTREPMRDFQEWIHYDTRYVRELSWRLDLWICWQTFRKMVANFIRQF